MSSLSGAAVAFAATAAFAITGPTGVLLSAGITALNQLLNAATGPQGPSLGQVLGQAVQSAFTSQTITNAGAVIGSAAQHLTDYAGKSGLDIGIPKDVDAELRLHPTGDFAMFFNPIVAAIQADSPLLVAIGQLGAAPTPASPFPNSQSQALASWAWGVGVHLNLAKTFLLVRSAAGNPLDKAFATALASQVATYVAQAKQVVAGIQKAQAAWLAGISPVRAGTVDTLNPFADTFAWYFTDASPQRLTGMAVDNCSGDAIGATTPGGGQVPAATIMYTLGYNPTNQASSQSDADTARAAYVSAVNALFPAAEDLAAITKAAALWQQLHDALVKAAA